ncbi:MAG: hypothetical protein JSV91_07900 [Phycisphaerales bacterium]|nr:MAG: hypothetical protein JSV91_07900 [Phycisphaerales bacterium]
MLDHVLTALVACVPAVWFSPLQEIPLEPGWPVATDFSVSPSGTAAQMDDDPELEVVIASQDEHVYVFNHDGTIVSGWPQYIGETQWPDQWANTNSTPAVADIDDDGEDEIIVGSLSAELYVFNRDGSYVPGFPYATSFMVYSTPALGDIDGDDELEIIFGDNHGYVYALNPDATDCAGFPYPTGYTVHASPALGDLDGDGYPEIVIGSEHDDPDFFALDGDGSDLPGFPLNLDPNVGIISSPSLGDLDLDGSLDIVVGCRNGLIVALNSAGEFLPGWPLDAGYSCQSSPTLVNLDDDPELEMVVGMNDSKVVAYNHDGTALPGWPVGTSYTVISSPSVADVDADGRVEIIVGENTGKVYGFETDGTPVAGFPLLDATYTVYSSPLLADLDLDGHLELLVGCNDTYVYCWDLGPDTHDPELAPWPQFRRDEVNNARLDRPAYAQISDAPSGVCPNYAGPLDLSVTSIVAGSVQFELWWRVFGEDGLIHDWPVPAMQVITLDGFETQHPPAALSVPGDAVPGEYLCQAYLGSQGESSFDTVSFDFTVNAPVYADVNGDCVVDIDDVFAVLAAWGPCENPDDCPADVDGTGTVDIDDIFEVLANWS